MSVRDLHFAPKQSDITLRFPPNWTAVIFLGVLGCLHMSIAIPAFYAGHFEGEMSLLLGTVFLTAASLCRLARSELVILASQRRLRQTLWLGRIWLDRATAFRKVREVRLYLDERSPGVESRIEIICDHDSIECPPSRVPRQEALCLAMTMNVPLVKVTAHQPLGPTASARLDALPHGEQIIPDDPN